MGPYRKFLLKDPKLKPFLKYEVGLPPKTKNLTMTLASSIISQQLSVKVARIIYLRFVALLPPRKKTAEEILKLSIADMRAIGLSTQKGTYIHNLANFMVEKKL